MITERIEVIDTPPKVDQFREKENGKMGVT